MCAESRTPSGQPLDWRPDKNESSGLDTVLCKLLENARLLHDDEAAFSESGPRVLLCSPEKTADSGMALLVIPEDAQLGLSARQLDVALLVAQGFSNPEIARRLGIRRPTVSVHLHKIYEQLHVKSRSELASKLIYRYILRQCADERRKTSARKGHLRKKSSRKRAKVAARSRARRKRSRKPGDR
jgi:DNA-binding CsgD family transcriptional regulator